MSASTKRRYSSAVGIIFLLLLSAPVQAGTSRIIHDTAFGYSFTLAPGWHEEAPDPGTKKFVSNGDLSASCFTRVTRDKEIIRLGTTRYLAEVKKGIPSMLEIGHDRVKVHTLMDVTFAGRIGVHSIYSFYHSENGLTVKIVAVTWQTIGGDRFYTFGCATRASELQKHYANFFDMAASVRISPSAAPPATVDKGYVTPEEAFGQGGPVAADQSPLSPAAQRFLSDYAHVLIGRGDIENMVARIDQGLPKSDSQDQRYKTIKRLVSDALVHNIGQKLIKDPEICDRDPDYCAWFLNCRRAYPDSKDYRYCGR